MQVKQDVQLVWYMQGKQDIQLVWNMQGKQDIKLNWNRYAVNETLSLAEISKVNKLLNLAEIGKINKILSFSQTYEYMFFWPQVEFSLSAPRLNSIHSDFACLQSIFTVRDAGFEPGNTASVVWSVTNEPPHFLIFLPRTFRGLQYSAIFIIRRCGGFW